MLTYSSSSTCDAGASGVHAVDVFISEVLYISSKTDYTFSVYAKQSGPLEQNQFNDCQIDVTFQGQPFVQYACNTSNRVGLDWRQYSCTFNTGTLTSIQAVLSFTCDNQPVQKEMRWTQAYLSPSIQ
jgi:hypothetical protein